MSEIALSVDGQEVEVHEEMTVLEAAIAAGIYVPALCYHPMLSPDGSCGLCLVEIEGIAEPATACNTRATEGMIVHTDTLQLRRHGGKC